MPPKLQNRYVIPVYFVGARVICEVRGPVTIVGLSEGPIRWPIGLSDGKQELIVYRGLAKAVREEFSAAVAAHWNTSLKMVRKWKAHLDNPPVVEPPKPIKRPRRPPRGGTPHQWTPEEDEIVRTKMTGEARKLLGVSVPTVIKRREQLGVGLHDLLGRG
jgi:hypothetical protein